MEYIDYFMISLGAVNLLLMYLLIRATSRQRRLNRHYEQKISLLNNEVSALCTGAASAGGHLNKIEQKMRRVLERQDQLDFRDPTDRALNQATRMVRQGAGIEELVSACGLGRAEAELLVLLHRAQAGGEPDAQLRVVSG